MKNFQCYNCKKKFYTNEVYLWGKDKHFFCQNCNEKNKKLCSWCEKDLNCQPGNFDKERCYLHDHRRQGIMDSDKNIEYEDFGFCDDNCYSQFNQYRENKIGDIFKQNREELLKKGYRECGAKLEVDGWTCANLILPNQSKCENCQKREHEQEKKQEAEKNLAERKKEYDKKYQQAQNWWNSLRHTEKQNQIKELEEKWQKEGWHSRSFSNDKNSLEFKNGKIYCDNWNKVPPPFLEKFGISYDYSEYTRKGKKSVMLSNVGLNSYERRK